LRQAALAAKRGPGAAHHQGAGDDGMDVQDAAFHLGTALAAGGAIEAVAKGVAIAGLCPGLGGFGKIIVPRFSGGGPLPYLLLRCTAHTPRHRLLDQARGLRG
jgi:hypothetical protein